MSQCIEPLGLTITDAAAPLGVTRNTLSELVNAKRGVSAEMAVRLSKVFGGTAEGWLVQQAQYELAQVRRDKPCPPCRGLTKGPLRNAIECAKVTMTDTPNGTSNSRNIARL